MKHILHQYFIPHEGNDHKPHILRPHVLSCASVITVLSKVIVTAILFFTFPSNQAFAEIVTTTLIDFANTSRQEAGLKPLQRNSLLEEAAMRKAQDMFARDYFDHNDPDGIPPWMWIRGAGYLYSYAGENLAIDFIDGEDVHKAWMKSESHRANLLKPQYRDIGIAVLQGKLGGKKTTLVVQFFGKSFTASEIASTTLPSIPQVSTPFYTEFLSKNSNPVLKGKEVEVLIHSVPEKNIFEYLLQAHQTFYLGLCAFFIIALLINISMRIKIQHKAVIGNTILVILLIGTMFFLKTHFLESIPFGINII